MKERPPLLTLTDAAVARARDLLARRDPPAPALRIGIKNTGCSGMSYAVDYADEIAAGDEVIRQQDVTLVVAPSAVLFLIGAEVDYVEDKLQSGFVFTNPNEAGRCGCGESFHV